MTKTNEEMAKELANYYAGETDYAECAAYDAALVMANRKDEEAKSEKQALIDKACEWLEHNVWEYTGFDSYELSEAFKNAMKGE